MKKVEMTQKIQILINTKSNIIGQIKKDRSACDYGEVLSLKDWKESHNVDANFESQYCEYVELATASVKINAKRFEYIKYIDDILTSVSRRTKGYQKKLQNAIVGYYEYFAKIEK